MPSIRNIWRTPTAKVLSDKALAPGSGERIAEIQVEGMVCDWG